MRQRNTVIRGLGHVIKEHKRGLSLGLRRRLAMTREVFLLHFDLYLFQTWRWINPVDQLGTDYDLFESS